MKYYVDTCIWRDYWEDRSDGLRPLGEFAYKFFMNLKHDDMILYSDVIIAELSNDFDSEMISRIFSIVPKSCLMFVRSDFGMRIDARKLSLQQDIPFGDALNILLAKKHDAILVTRDRHYTNFFTPESLF